MKKVFLLWHEDRPVGVCVFCAPAAALKLRNQYFRDHEPGVSTPGWKGPPGVDTPGSMEMMRGHSLSLKWINQNLWLLARVVLHPSYRGAGLATCFVKKCCAACPIPWIETLTALGHFNPFFERAGFRRIGVCRKRFAPPKNDAPLDFEEKYRNGLLRIYGGRARLSPEMLRKSLFAEPVYYVLDNRKRGK